jgi:hypothetical protein
MSRFKHAIVFMTFQILTLLSLCLAVETSPFRLNVIKSEIQSTLDRANMSMRAKDLHMIVSAFAQTEELVSVGLDSHAFGWDSLEKTLKQQMEIVNDYQSSLKDRKIIVDPDGKRAR